MSNRLEIKLTEANGTPVSLLSMSPEALESFMTVVSSLKSIAVSIIPKDEITFSISEGSAQCAVVASDAKMDSLYSTMDYAINGSSDDKELTGQLRIIQNQLKQDSFKYMFNYKKNKHSIDLHARLIQSNRISTKRKKRVPFHYKLKIVRGLLNQIGGKDPNYHFDYGHGDKLTIDCTKNEAMIINQYLYKDVASLLLCKEWLKVKKKDEYFHKIILEENLVGVFEKYLKSYHNKEDLVEKLTQTHDFIDDMFENSNDGHKVLKYLLIAFNDNNFHLSELKTLLVISKPFKEHPTIKEARNSLYYTYQKKRE